MMTVADMLGREVVLQNIPKRIVSLVPSQTELLADLGLEEEVTGITKFCVHPERWFRSKTRIGGTKTVDIEKVRALKPDLILANKEENVQEQIDELSKEFPVWVSEIDDLDDALRMITEVGSLTGKESASISIAASIAAGFRELWSSEGSTKKVAYAIWREPWMWAGSWTFIHDMLARMNWANVIEEQRYPSKSLEEVRAFSPDIVLLSSEPYPFKEKHLAEVKAAMPAADVFLVDGEMFSWYGSRLLKAPAYFASLISQLPPH